MLAAEDRGHRTGSTLSDWIISIAGCVACLIWIGVALSLFGSNTGMAGVAAFSCLALLAWRKTHRDGDRAPEAGA